MENVFDHLTALGSFMLIGGIILWITNPAYMALAILLIVYGILLVGIFTTLNSDFLDYPVLLVASCILGVLGLIVLALYAIIDFSGFVSTFFPSV